MMCPNILGALVYWHYRMNESSFDLHARFNVDSMEQMFCDSDNDLNCTSAKKLKPGEAATLL